MPSTITIITSPYHVGIPSHRVGAGPSKILSLSLLPQLHALGLRTQINEIPSVDDHEGEIGRSFELLRRISHGVSAAVQQGTFPLILAGNCMSSTGVACGLPEERLAVIYFDAHDDFDTPETKTSGYFDAMGVAMMRGECWGEMMRSVEGFRPVGRERFVYCGVRDQTELQRRRVEDAGFCVIRGRRERGEVDYAGELQAELEKGGYSPALVHVDMDVLDSGLGKANDYAAPGGLSERDLLECLEMIPRKVTPTSLTVASFDPGARGGDKIGRIAVDGIIAFMRSLLETGVLSKEL
ncbi:arginase protein [Rutstroemia sp. NJR-2017a BVV2]|nr:arginase protein [Rutstroemia sp. NJR-2017a BVV2]